MAKGKNTVITCAVTGSAHSPTMSGFLPVTPDQIAGQSIDAVRAGAAIIHLHARDPDDGRPSHNPDLYRPVVERLRAETDAIINITTSGSSAHSIETRIAAAQALRPDMVSLNMGTMSPYGRDALLTKFHSWQHPWEAEALAGARDRVYLNTETVIETIIRRLSPEGLRFECECYDVGHLYTVAHFADRGLLTAPFAVQTVFGFSGGIAAEATHVTHMEATARRLFGADLRWGVLAPGRHQMRICTMAACMGANVRVGMEDSLTLGAGRPARANAEQVALIRGLLESLSIKIASPAEARAELAL